jgi:Flp pilus assembly protein TadB
MSCARNFRGWIMWVSRPIYESLPYFYIVAGALTLAASMYLGHWYWPTICFFVGLASLVGGLVVLLKRRDYRHQERRSTRTTNF